MVVLQVMTIMADSVLYLMKKTSSNVIIVVGPSTLRINAGTSMDAPKT